MEILAANQSEWEWVHWEGGLKYTKVSCQDILVEPQNKNIDLEMCMIYCHS